MIKPTLKVKLFKLLYSDISHGCCQRLVTHIKTKRFVAFFQSKKKERKKEKGHEAVLSPPAVILAALNQRHLKITQRKEAVREFLNHSTQSSPIPPRVGSRSAACSACTVQLYCYLIISYEEICGITTFLFF